MVLGFVKKVFKREKAEIRAGIKPLHSAADTPYGDKGSVVHDVQERDARVVLLSALLSAAVAAAAGTGAWWWWRRNRGNTGNKAQNLIDQSANEGKPAKGKHFSALMRDSGAKEPATTTTS